MEAKIKHLEFLQPTINRMATNSFLLKGWAVTLTGGLLALTFKQIDHRYLLISLAVLLLFWSLDGYYLSRERRFVALFNQVRTKDNTCIDFSMETHLFNKTCRWITCSLSKTLSLFYGGLLVVHFTLMIFI